MTLNPMVKLPEAQYAHPELSTEWWWHIGTLVADNGQKFGFEINALRFEKYLASQISLSDVANQKHYQEVTTYLIENIDPNIWAEKDPSKPWYVGLENPLEPNKGYISMKAPQNDPTNMHVVANCTDQATGKVIKFDLQLKQEGAPLLVWGDGVRKVPNEGTNYYYSLTNLQASGTITICGTDDTVEPEVFNVTGVTWMDHEYGEVQGNYWCLQDMQLSNGIHICDITDIKQMEEGIPYPSNATVLKDGESHYIETVVTPSKPYQGPNNMTYFLEYQVEIINQLGMDASFTVSALMQNQVFTGAKGKGDIYEGAAKCTGTIKYPPSEVIEEVTGTAWLEQRFVATNTES